MIAGTHNRRRLRRKTKLGILSSVALLALWLASIKVLGGHQGEHVWVSIVSGELGIITNPLYDDDLCPRKGWYVEALSPRSWRWSSSRVKDDWNRIVLGKLPDGWLTTNPEMIRSDVMKRFWRDFSCTFGIKMPQSVTHTFPVWTHATSATDLLSNRSDVSEPTGGDVGETHHNVPRFCTLSTSITDETRETTYISVPLWCFALPLFAMTTWFVWRDRRYARGCCQACGYDLRGCTSGKCPECGEAHTEGSAMNRGKSARQP